jgi:hypothetical protein
MKVVYDHDTVGSEGMDANLCEGGAQQQQWYQKRKKQQPAAIQYSQPCFTHSLFLSGPRSLPLLLSGKPSNSSAALHADQR